VQEGQAAEGILALVEATLAAAEEQACMPGAAGVLHLHVCCLATAFVGQCWHSRSMYCSSKGQRHITTYGNALLHSIMAHLRVYDVQQSVVQQRGLLIVSTDTQAAG